MAKRAEMPPFEAELYERIRVWLAKQHGMDPRELDTPRVEMNHVYYSEETGCDYQVVVSARIADRYQRKLRVAQSSSGSVRAEVADFGAFIRAICAE